MRGIVKRLGEKTEIIHHRERLCPPDNAGFKVGVFELYLTFPDFYAMVDDLLIDLAEGKVAIHWSAEGIHRGTFLDMPPNGRRLPFQGIEIIRIVKCWG